MSTLLASLLIGLSSLTAPHAECKFLPSSGGSAIQQCNLQDTSPKALKRDIFVKVWLPAQIDDTTDVLVFLHGRGYASFPGQKSAMLEHMGLNAYFATNAYKRRPFIIVAPQDTIAQTDNSAIGEDYWTGANGRDWQSFLTRDLVDVINKHFSLRPRPWKALGVSMGAHGAMMLAMNHPQAYSAFAAISPVFRATLPEIGKYDFDIFVRDGAIVNNIGYLLLQNAKLPKLPPHFIRIHQYDFALDPIKFPSAQRLWQRLMSLPQDPEDTVKITHEVGIQPGNGHSMDYWKMILPQALTWLRSR